MAARNGLFYPSSRTNDDLAEWCKCIIRSSTSNGNLEEATLWAIVLRYIASDATDVLAEREVINFFDERKMGSEMVAFIRAVALSSTTPPRNADITPPPAIETPLLVETPEASAAVAPPLVAAPDSAVVSPPLVEIPEAAALVLTRTPPAFRVMPLWVRRFDIWLKEELRASARPNSHTDENHKKVMRAVERFALGNGFIHKHCITGSEFMQQREPVSLEKLKSFGFETALKDGRKWQCDTGSKDHGWCCAHPLKKMKLYTDHLNANGDGN